MNNDDTIEIQNCTYQDFQKLDLRVAKVTAAEYVPKADKLIKITLDAGDLGTRTVLSGIRQWYSVEDLVGKSVIYLSNLEPRVIRGVESQGMILAAGEKDVALLSAIPECDPGTKVL